VNIQNISNLPFKALPEVADHSLLAHSLATIREKETKVKRRSKEECEFGKNEAMTSLAKKKATRFFLVASFPFCNRQGQ
jgi:hypothetical protein